MKFLNSLKPYLHFCSHINPKNALGFFAGSQGEGAGSPPWAEQELQPLRFIFAPTLGAAGAGEEAGAQLAGTQFEDDVMF